MKKTITILFLFCSIISFGQISAARKLLLAQTGGSPYYVTHSFVSSNSTENIYTSVDNLQYGDLIILMAAAKGNENLTLYEDVLMSELANESGVGMSTVIGIGFHKGADGDSFGKQIRGETASNKAILIVVYRNVKGIHYNNQLLILNQYYDYRLQSPYGYKNNLAIDIFLDSSIGTSYEYYGTDWTIYTNSDTSTNWIYGHSYFQYIEEGATEKIYRAVVPNSYRSNYMVPLYSTN